MAVSPIPTLLFEVANPKLTSSPTRTPLWASTRTINLSLSAPAVASRWAISGRLNTITSFLGSLGKLVALDFDLLPFPLQPPYESVGGLHVGPDRVLAERAWLPAVLAKVDSETIQHLVVYLSCLGKAGVGGPGQGDFFQREAVVTNRLEGSWWSPRRDSNPRPLPYQGSALPTELRGRRKGRRLDSSGRSQTADQRHPYPDRNALGQPAGPSATFSLPWACPWPARAGRGIRTLLLRPEL